MSSFLFLGFLIGMKHALEADHLAAVASMVAGSKSVKDTVKMGAIWGCGHASALFVFCALAILSDALPVTAWSSWLEGVVGLMLIVLGGDVLRRLYRDRVHFHVHRHHSGDVHFHAHTHTPDIDHKTDSHDHTHRKPARLKTLSVGIMHGMAGSAVLIVLSAGLAETPWIGLLYVALFGAGSILGMALLSMIIAVPMAYSARYLTWGNRIVHVSVGSGTIVLGGYVTYGAWIAS